MVSQLHLFVYLYIDDFVDFPEFNDKSNKYADFNNKIGFIVENVQQYDQWLKDIEENWAYWQTLEWLAVSPELNICLSHADNSKATGL